METPVLTRAGQTFASRMAGALLTAADLPELITTDLTSYEAKALALAREPSQCHRLRAHLAETKKSGVLFDTPRFVRELESRLTGLVQR